MHKRRKYNQEYKREVVQLVRQSDTPLAQAAANLGDQSQHSAALVAEISKAGNHSFPGNSTPRDLELARLKRELQQVRQERDFLEEEAACPAG